MKHDDLIPKIDDILNDCKPFLSIIGNNPKYIPVRTMGTLASSYYGHNIEYFKTRPDRTGKINRGITKTILENTFEDKNIPSRYKNSIITSSLGKNSLFGFDEDEACYIIPKGEFSYAYIANDFNSGSFERIGNIYVSLANVLDDFDEVLGEFDSVFKSATVEEIPSISKKYTDIALSHVGDGDIKMQAHIEKTYETSVKIINRINEEYFSEKGIHTDNYKKAFDSEHEIWFNCEGYYGFPYTNSALIDKVFSDIRNS